MNYTWLGMERNSKYRTESGSESQETRVSSIQVRYGMCVIQDDTESLQEPSPNILCKRFFRGQVHCLFKKILNKLWQKYRKRFIPAQLKARFELCIFKKPKSTDILSLFAQNIFCLELSIPRPRDDSPGLFEPKHVITNPKFEALLKS